MSGYGSSDQHFLRDYSNATALGLNVVDTEPNYDHDAAQEWDGASDLAIDLLSSAGLTYDDTDSLHEAVHEDIQTLLLLAFARSPRLADHIQHLLELDR